MDRVTALKKAGKEVQSLHGMFSVPQGTRDWSLLRASAESVNKYVANFEKQGWTLESKPQVKKVKDQEPLYQPVPMASGKGFMFKPVGTGMPIDHPWRKSGTDQYTVEAWWSRDPIQFKLEIPDDTFTRLVKSGKLPTGVKLAE